MNRSWSVLVMALAAGMVPCANLSAGDIHDAVRSGDVWKVRELLAENPDQVNNATQEGRTALHIAVYRGQVNMVELLLARKADLRARDNYGRTPLHEAIVFGSKDVVGLLMTRKADVNARDKQGSTPLHEAVRRGSATLVMLLLAYKPDVNARDSKGRTPLDVASRLELADLLHQHGAKSGEELARMADGLTRSRAEPRARPVQP